MRPAVPLDQPPNTMKKLTGTQERKEWTQSGREAVQAAAADSLPYQNLRVRAHG